MPAPMIKTCGSGGVALPFWLVVDDSNEVMADIIYTLSLFIFMRALSDFN